MAAAEAEALGVDDDVGAVLAVDAFLQGVGVVAVGALVPEDQVEASLVERHGVGRGQDAHILHARRGGVPVAVAVDRQVVHHVDVDYVASLLLEVAVHRLGGGGHAFEKGVLLGGLPAAVGGAGRVDVEFAAARRHADGEVLQRPAEAAHSMPLEVREVYHEVVVRQVATHLVVFDIGGVPDRQAHGALGVHDVHVAVAAFRHLLPVALGLGPAGEGVGRVALHQGAVHAFHQRHDELRRQLVALLRLAGAYLHRHAAQRLDAQGLEDAHQRLGADIAREVDRRPLGARCGLVG